MLCSIAAAIYAAFLCSIAPAIFSAFLCTGLRLLCSAPSQQRSVLLCSAPSQQRSVLLCSTPSQRRSVLPRSALLIVCLSVFAMCLSSLLLQSVTVIERALSDNLVKLGEGHDERGSDKRGAFRNQRFAGIMSQMFQPDQATATATAT